MKSRSAIPISIVVLLTLVISPQVSAKTIAGTVEFYRHAWETVERLHSVPVEVVSALQKEFSSIQPIADRGEPWEPTNVESTRPSRRFVLGGHADALWFILYERGGRGHQLVLAIVDVAASPAKVVMFARGNAGVHDDIAGWRVDLAELKSALGSESMTWENPRGPEY